MTKAYSPQAAQPRDRRAPTVTFHPELVEAAAREAARDAENVALFLRELRFVPSADRPVRLPPAFLLHLGAALRLLVWESGGLRVHQDSGLPMAERAIIDTFGLLDGASEAEAQHPVELARKVVALFADRFAWHGPRDLDADVVLDDHIDEDALVDALAELLWDVRHARSQAPMPVKEISDG